MVSVCHPSNKLFKCEIFILRSLAFLSRKSWHRTTGSWVVMCLIRSWAYFSIGAVLVDFAISSFIGVFPHCIFKYQIWSFAHEETSCVFSFLSSWTKWERNIFGLLFVYLSLLPQHIPNYFSMKILLWFSFK